MNATDTRRTIDTVWRMESARIIAGVARLVRDVGLAEELAHDALVAALEQWPVEGLPPNPAAWLATIAKRRAIDWLRRRNLQQRKQEELASQWNEAETPDDESDTLDDDIGDNLLRLIFVACHPVLSPEARVALTLKTLGSFTTAEIGRAFLVPEATIAQRIVRAKRNLTEKQVPFEVPSSGQLAERLSSVLEVLYLLFNEGYSATAGDDWIRPGLCEEAQRLGRILAELIPGEAEVHGLLALMEIQASRLKARTKPDGEPVLLLDQNRAQWDQLLIHRGLAALERGRALRQPRGFYLLQAEIAACHARAIKAEATDWQRIADIYGEMLESTPSPIIELNRAVAIGMAQGPAAALPLVDALRDDAALEDYHLLSSVRGDLLFKLGRFNEAREEFERAAAGMTGNNKERQMLLRRSQECQANKLIPHK